MTKRIGTGGFARVFECKRKKDDMVCALKFMIPRNPVEKQNIINEVGLM